MSVQTYTLRYEFNAGALAMRAVHEAANWGRAHGCKAAHETFHCLVVERDFAGRSAAVVGAVDHVGWVR